MKYFLLLILFSGSVFADAIDDARLVLDTLSGKTLNGTQTLTIVDGYNTAKGFSNPWSEEDNPAEFAAWPTNIEKATFFLARLRGEIRSDIGAVAGKTYDASARANRVASVAAAENEL